MTKLAGTKFTLGQDFRITDRLTIELSQSATGSVSVLDYGAKGDGVTDDTAAIQAAADSLAQVGTPPSTAPFRLSNGAVFLPRGTYNVGASIVLPAGVSLVMAPGATIKAAASMTAVITTAEASYLDLHQNTGVFGGCIDCADLADVAIWPKYFAFFRIDGVQTFSAKVDHIRLGSSSAPASSYEAFIVNCLFRRTLTAYPANLAGIRFTNCGDSHVSDTVIMGVQKGVAGTVYDSKFDRVHVWNPVPISGYSDTDAGVALGIGFETAGQQNIYTQCQVDGPLVSGGAGWYLTAAGNSLIGCSVNGVGVPDNQCFGAYLDTGAVSAVIGCTFKGGSVSARLAADVAGPGVSGTTLSGNDSTINVVTVAGNSTGISPLYVAGDVRIEKTITAAGTAGAQTINKNAGSVNFAAAATSVTVTNNRVTANSVVVATIATQDATFSSVQAIPGAGSFTLVANAAATAETRVNFVVVN
jgi:hypothetical protein